MIYISQGHEKGIGLEVFFKSCLSLPQHVLDTFCLYVSIKSAKETLNSLNLDYNIENDNISLFSKTIKIETIEATDPYTESSQSLVEILKTIKPKDILITLPTSKDQLTLNNINCAGYTEFFRNYFNKDSISMIFKSYDLNILLLSDHIPLRDVTTKLNKEIIESKLQQTLSGIKKYFKEFPQEIHFAGINPHAGENGVLGNEDSIIEEVITSLTLQFPMLSLLGPHPGDTLHFHHNPERRQLFVYSFHDQGLPFFKDKYGLFGINITMGLDFLRMSVDHGTAFSLFGKNQASSSGCLYVLNEAYKVHSL